MTTTRRINKKARGAGGKIRLFLILLVIFLTSGAVTVGWVYYSQEETPTKLRAMVQQTVVEPTISAVSSAPTNPPIKIEAVIPTSLTDEKRFGLWVVEQVLDDPERWVEEPKIEMSDNDRQVFIALILTESSFRQFAEDGSTLDSGIDCDGLAQLCNNPAVCAPDVRWNPFENVYCGMRYFKELVEKWAGNYSMAIAEYKGAINTLPSGQTVPIPDHPAVRDLFDYIVLR